jgi:Dolichyl-phosphate-mannose-protein mannosyltransferase
MRLERMGPSLRLAALCAAPAALVALAVLLPFLKKAFTSDDVTYLLEARHVLVDPVHPTAFDLVDQGIRIRLSQLFVTGPVMAYFLIPCVLLGGAEWVAHALQASLVVITALATAALGLRLGLSRAQASIAALFVVVSPAVLGMAGTAMPDVPAMAFTVTGMERLVAWLQTRRWAAAIAAAWLLALAALSRPHVLLIFVCAAVWLVSEQRWGAKPLRRQDGLFIRAFLILGFGLALVALVVYVTRDPASGDTVASATLRRVEPQRVTFNLASFAMHWVVAFPLGLAWPLLRGHRFLSSRRTYGAFALAAILVLSGDFVNPDWRWMLAILLAVGLGLDVLADILFGAWRRRDPTQLLLAMWLLIAVVAAPYLQLPSKLLIPSAPAMAILIAREVRLPDAASFRLKLLGTVAILGLIVGLLVIRADTAWAEIGREGGRVAGQLTSRHRRVWSDGASGFQWYAMAAGAEPLAETQPLPGPGDLVVASLHARLLREEYPNKTLFYRRIYAEPGGRVQGEGAGFFTNSAVWPLPWAWGHRELGRIEVWRIDGMSARSERPSYGFDNFESIRTNGQSVTR